MKRAKKVFPSKYNSNRNRVKKLWVPRYLMLDAEDAESQASKEESLDPLSIDNRSGDYWFDNHGRVSSISGPKNNKLPKLESAWTTKGVVQERKVVVIKRKGKIVGWDEEITYRKKAAVAHQVPPTVRRTVVQPVCNEQTGEYTAEVPRRTVEKLIKTWQQKDQLGHAGQGIDEWHYKTYDKTPEQHLKLFFHADRFRWGLELTVEKICKLSATYRSLIAAEQSLKNRDIQWIETINLAEKA